MSDYEPDYVYMIPVAYKRREIFYETFTKAPSHVRGAFLLDEDKNEEIEFSILSPTNQIMCHNTTSQSIFEFEAKETGTYQIVFDNRYTNSDVKVTFTMNTGQNPILKKEDLNVTEEKQKSLLDFMSRYSLQFKMRHNVHAERYKSKKNLK